MLAQLKPIMLRPSHAKQGQKTRIAVYLPKIEKLVSDAAYKYHYKKCDFAME